MNEEYEVLPLVGIPVGMEDEPLHTAENGYVCGSSDCWCAGSDGEEVA